MLIPLVERLVRDELINAMRVTATYEIAIEARVVISHEWVDCM